TVPNGYLLVGTYQSGTASTSAKVEVFRRTALASDQSVSVAFSSSAKKAVTVSVYRGVDPVNPIDTSSSASTTAGTSVVAPSLTTAAANEELVLMSGATNTGTAGTFSAPSGMTMRAQQAGGTTLSDGVADQSATSAGSTGTRTATYNKTANLVGVL